MKIFSKMNSLRAGPGPAGSETTIIRSVELRDIFFIFDLSWRTLGSARNQRKTDYFRKNGCHEIAFFHSAMRASRTAFEIEAFLEETPHTFETSRDRCIS